MIYDRFENRERYIGEHPLFKKGFDFIEEYLNNPLEPGVYELDGDKLFAIVQSYLTREEGLLEVHKKHIDIQYMAEGAEKVYYADREGIESAGEYDAQKDALFLKDSEEMMEFTFRKGEFVIFFPEDAHKPSLKLERPKDVRKIVLKVSVD